MTARVHDPVRGRVRVGQVGGVLRLARLRGRAVLAVAVPGVRHGRGVVRVQALALGLPGVLGARGQPLPAQGHHAHGQHRDHHGHGGVDVQPLQRAQDRRQRGAQQGALNAFTGFLIALLIFTVRMLAYRYQWRLPGAHVTQDKDQLDRLRRLAEQAQAAAARRAARARERAVRSAAGPGGMAVDAATAVADRAASHPPAPAGYHYDAVEDAYTRDEEDVFGPAEEYEDQVRVEDWDPDTQSITVVDEATHQSVRYHPETGVMDVTDLRTGRTRSYDDPEDDWVADTGSDGDARR